MTSLPFDQREGTILLDGEMLAWKDAKIHVLSHALHYGSCVFEGERAYNGIIFKGPQHSRRLIKSGEILGMTVPLKPEEIDAAKEKILKENNIRDGYIRAFAWRGSEQMAISAQKTKIHWAIAAWEWPSYFDPEKRAKGLNLKTANWRRPAADCAPGQSKAAGLYMICTMSKHAAEEAGYDDALMLDYRGYVAEATGANLFFVKEGRLITPTPDCFLNGITRQTVIEIARDKGIEVEERHIRPEELADFEEAFLTGTAAEVTAIGKIDHHRFTVGETTQALRSAYEDLVNGRSAHAPAKAAG